MTTKQEKKDFVITREFNAPRDLVWKCWTQREHIEKWGAPQGFSLISKVFDFKVGGENFYCQKSADGHEMWGKQTYIEIQPTHKLVYTQSFADEKGNIIAHPMSATWPLKMLTTISLEEKENKTVLTLIWTPYQSNDEGIATFNGAMDGMSKGWAGSFAKFDEYLVEIQKENSNSTMEFFVNLETKTTTIKREFASPLSLVWDAFTKSEILDKWWAPKPFESRTKSMNFEVGGRRFYAMVTPEGQERWAIQRYISISPKTNFKMYNTFADKEENPELPGSEWDFNFTEQTGKTTVSISIYNESRERMEKMIEMGFKEGITATLNELEVLLTSPSQNKEVNMNKLHFSITINAPKAKVWNTMLGDATYRVWTEAFNPGSHYVGDWSKGSKILFLGPDPTTGKMGGMVSRIEENRLHEHISIEHLGMVNDGIEDTTSELVKAFAGAHENYTFKENDKKTEVLVDIDSSGGEFEEMFKDMWPKALQKLKELAEK